MMTCNVFARGHPMHTKKSWLQGGQGADLSSGAVVGKILILYHSLTPRTPCKTNILPRVNLYLVSLRNDSPFAASLDTHQP